MKPLPYVHRMPRVKADIKDCLSFRESRYGSGATRKNEILVALKRVYAHPKARRVALRKSRVDVELRAHHVAQFVIIYAYFEPNAVMPYGMVSIRAIRHRRVRNLFYGVKDACGNISDSSVDVCTRLASP